MPWWSWVAIWGGLVVVLVVMLVLLGMMLFRKLMAVFTALGVLADRTELLQRAGEILDEQHRELALLVGLAETRRRREEVRARSRVRRDARHDARLVRARSIIAVDASSRRWFPEA
jgi:hypothetical protein